MNVPLIPLTVLLATRRAMLGVLAGIDTGIDTGTGVDAGSGALVFHDSVTDRLSRSGFAVSDAAGGVEYMLVSDPVSGRILAPHQRSLGGDQHLDHLTVQHGVVRYYALFVDQDRRRNSAEATVNGGRRSAPRSASYGRVWPRSAAALRPARTTVRRLLTDG